MKLYYCAIGSNLPTTDTSKNATVPSGSVLMNELQPTPEHIANELGEWVLPPNDDEAQEDGTEKDAE